MPLPAITCEVREPAARQQLFLKLAEIIIAITTDDSQLAISATGAIEHFCAHQSPADVLVRVSRAAVLIPPRGEKLFDSGSLWQVYRESEGYLFRFAIADDTYKTARFNRTFTEGTVQLNSRFFAPGELVYPLEYPLDELLLINLLAHGRGVEVHACGVIDASGKGYLFAGQSGAGKTTTARLWQRHSGVKILSDDRIVLRRRAGRIWMYGTPWHGEAELALPEQAPLERIFFLKQWPGNAIVPLRRAEAAARLLACGFPTFYRPSGLAFTLGFYDEITQRVPCAELRFLPAESAVALVRTAEGKNL